MSDSGRIKQDEAAWLAIENAALKSEIINLRRFIDTMQNLADAAHQPRPSEEILDLLDDVLLNARRAMNAKDGSLLVLDEDSGAALADGERWVAGEALVETLREAEYEGQPVFEVVPVDSQRAAEIILRERKASLLILIPSDFRFNHG